MRAAGNLHSFISMYFFQAVLNIFPIVLTRRIGLTIKCILSWLSFPVKQREPFEVVGVGIGVGATLAFLQHYHYCHFLDVHFSII